MINTKNTTCLLVWKLGNAKIFLFDNKNKNNKKFNINELKKYIDYCIQKLFEENLYRLKKIEIMISFTTKDQIKNFLFDKKENDVFVYGYCLWEDSQKPYKTFTIKIVDSLDEKNLYKTIAHELTHAYQYRMGILYQDFRDNTTVWNGVKYKEDMVNYSVENLPPWEKDAIKKEIQLYRGWKIKKSKNLTKNKI